MQTTADMPPASSELSQNSPLPFSSQRPTASAPVVLQLTEVTTAKKPWTLTLYPEHLALSDSADGQPYIILRQQLLQSASLAAGVQILALRAPIKMTFRLSKEGATAFADWIGKPTLASYYLKQRYSWLLPLAILMVIGSVPLPADASSGATAIPFNPLGFGLGIGLAISWALAKWRPHPVLFLVDSVWLTIYSAQLVLRVVNGGSKFPLIFLPLLLWMVLKGFNHFSQFRNTRLR
jgi:hypothetical protein